MTDDLPLNVHLSEHRRVTVMNESYQNNSVNNDSFDIPLLSEVNMSTEEELQDLEKKIRNVKSRLGLLVESEGEEEVGNEVGEEGKLA